MTDQDRQNADRLLGRIETAAGQLPNREGVNAALITEIIQCVNGLRSLLGAVRAH
jgi:hypothetical protein